MLLLFQVTAYSYNVHLWIDIYVIGKTEQPVSVMLRSLISNKNLHFDLLYSYLCKTARSQLHVTCFTHDHFHE